MNERVAFLRAIAANEDDALVRLVYADWLEEHGEHEEAERQRKWPESKKWLDNICRKINASRPVDGALTYDQLLDFGRRVSTTSNAEIVFSVDDDDIPNGPGIITAIRDHIPDYWQAWSVVTGLPLNTNIQQKSYVNERWECCVNEVYPERHLAGPKPERFIRAEEEEARSQREEELQQQMNWDKQFDAIQDILEKDRP
jgi:uncharacterized protein (TIGR02996 family)